MSTRQHKGELIKKSEFEDKKLYDQTVKAMRQKVSKENSKGILGLHWKLIEKDDTAQIVCDID